MTMFPADARHYIQTEYEQRHARNPSYSWRSFARDLLVSPSMLSEVVKGRYGLSRPRALDVAARLRLDDVHSQHFADLFEAGFHRSSVRREKAKARIEERLKDPCAQGDLQALRKELSEAFLSTLKRFSVATPPDAVVAHLLQGIPLHRRLPEA